MVGTMEQALVYAALLPHIRAKFDKATCPVCGAKPKEWCEQRVGTIHSERGA